MMDDPNLDLELISIKLLRDYLKMQGWEQGSGRQAASPRASVSQAPFFISARKPSVRPEIYYLQAPGGAFIEIAVPSKQDLPASSRDMEDAVKTIAEVEGKTPWQVLVDIHSVGFDIIRNRIPITTQDRGTIRLELAAEYIQKTKELLSAAATTEMEPNSSFRRTLKEALAFSDHCRFGHTFKGSFGFTIESAVPPNITPNLFPIGDPPPFERRVIRRLANGLELARRATQEDDLTPLIESSDSALGANGYELIADLVAETPRKDITFDFAFSPSWKEHAVGGDRLSINLEAQHIDAFRSAAKQMRQPSVDVPAQVSGLITDLSLANPSSLNDTRNKRRIIILWSSEQFGDIRVAANVSAQTYLRALSLHREEKPIMVAGMLRKVGRTWNLVIPNEELSDMEGADPSAERSDTDREA